MNLKAGSLDDRSWLVPVGHVWAESAQPWVEIDRSAGALVFEKQPADFEEFMRRWRPGNERSKPPRPQPCFQGRPSAFQPAARPRWPLSSWGPSNPSATL